jgi:hypothetical protein
MNLAAIAGLYQQYMRLALIGMLCAVFIFPFAAGVITGDATLILHVFASAAGCVLVIFAAIRFDMMRRFLKELIDILRERALRSQAQQAPAQLIGIRELRRLWPLRRSILTLSTPEKMYVVGTLLGCVSFASLILFGLLRRFGGVRADLFLPFAGLLIATGLFAGGAALDVTNALRRVWATIVGKLFLGLLATFVANAANIFARQEVNSLTRVDPANFTVAIAAVAVPLALVLWAAIIVVLLSLTFFLGHLAVTVLYVIRGSGFGDLFLAVRDSTLYRFLLNKRKFPRRAFSLFILARLVGIALLAIVTLMTLLMMSSGGQLRKLSTEIFIMTETYEHSRCANHSEGERVAFWGDGKILVVRPNGTGGYTFEAKPCD